MTTEPIRQPGIATGLSLLIPITLSTMAIVLLAPVLPQMLDTFKNVPGADFLVPMILTMPALCIVLLSPVAGIFGDYFGRRRLLILSLSLYGIVGVAPVFLSNLTAILCSRILVGVAEAFIIVTTTTLIGDYYAGQVRDKWLAAQTACASVSALLFFNLGGLLGQSSWRPPFWVYSSALAMLVAVLAFTWEPSARPRPSEGSEAHEAAGWADFPWSRMIGIILITVFGSVLFFTIQIQASRGLTAHGISDPAQVGFLASVASLGTPIGTYVYGKLDHSKVKRLLLAEFLILGCGYLTMGMAQTWRPFLIGCGISQIGAGLLLPTLLVWAMSQLRFEVRARGTGIWQSALAFGQFLSPIIVAVLARMNQGLFAAFTWLGYAGFLAALVTLAAMLAGRRSLRPLGTV